MPVDVFKSSIGNYTFYVYYATKMVRNGCNVAEIIHRMDVRDAYRNKL